MNKLLRKFQKRVQRTSTVNNNEFSGLTRNSNHPTQSSDRQGLPVRKGLAQVALGILVIITVYTHSAKVEALSKEIECGHVISSIRIVRVIEIVTELEKQCPEDNSASKQQKPQEPSP